MFAVADCGLIVTRKDKSLAGHVLLAVHARQQMSPARREVLFKFRHYAPATGMSSANESFLGGALSNYTSTQTHSADQTEALSSISYCWRTAAYLVGRANGRWLTSRPSYSLCTTSLLSDIPIRAVDRNRK
jgi:hypothetical protein